MSYQKIIETTLKTNVIQNPDQYFSDAVNRALDITIKNLALYFKEGGVESPIKMVYLFFSMMLGEYKCKPSIGMLQKRAENTYNMLGAYRESLSLEFKKELKERGLA